MTNLRTSVAAVTAAATLVFTASACGGGSNSKVASLGKSNSSSSQGSTGDAKKSFQDALLEFSKCMRQHGVDLPDPTFDDTGAGGVAMVGGDPSKMPSPDSAVYKAAQTACQPILDAVEKTFGPQSAEEQAKMRDRALAFAKCMRSKGVDVPDPTFDDNGGMKIEAHGGPPDGSSSGDVQTATPDPKFEEAAKVCDKEGGGPVIRGSGSTTGAATSGGGK
jgi:hypothetical protein